MFIMGTLLGPMHHYYYMYLDKILPKATIKTVLQKIICDQLFASPGTIFLFFTGMDLMEGKNIEQTMTEIKRKFVFVYTVNLL